MYCRVSRARYSMNPVLHPSWYLLEQYRYRVPWYWYRYGYNHLYGYRYNNLVHAPTVPGTRTRVSGTRPTFPPRVEARRSGFRTLRCRYHYGYLVPVLSGHPDDDVSCARRCELCRRTPAVSVVGLNGGGQNYAADGSP